MSYASQEEAAEAARASIAALYAPLGKVPKVYTVEVEGVQAVLLPWGATKMAAAIKKIGDINPQSLLFANQFAEAMVVDCLFWISGQTEPGKNGALKHARALAELDGYESLFSGLAGAVAVQKENAPGK